MMFEAKQVLEALKEEVFRVARRKKGCVRARFRGNRLNFDWKRETLSISYCDEVGIFGTEHTRSLNMTDPDAFGEIVSWINSIQARHPEAPAQ